jgi:hypothetical protein
MVIGVNMAKVEDKLSVLSNYCMHNGDQIVILFQQLIECAERLQITDKKVDDLEARIKELEHNQNVSTCYDLSEASEETMQKFFEHHREHLKKIWEESSAK